MTAAAAHDDDNDISNSSMQFHNYKTENTQEPWPRNISPYKPIAFMIQDTHPSRCAVVPPLVPAAVHTQHTPASPASRIRTASSLCTASKKPRAVPDLSLPPGNPHRASLGWRPCSRTQLTQAGGV